MERRNRLIIFAIPVIIVLLVLIAYQYGYEKVRADIASVREMEVAKTKTLERYVTIIAGKPELESRLTALKEKRKADDAKLVQGDTSSLAANTLEDTVKGIITGRGGTISSERVEKPEDLGNFKVVNVTMDVVLPDTRALSDVIYSIETRTPYIVIKELDTRVRNFREPRDLMVKVRVAALTGGK
ncbi:MAG TPA: type II secretion system protein GspM [Syntrophorhabdaceae bacterium]|nr:type II secretion system protein GspM [Syntrophorhabdaceae bacterium]